MDIKAKIESEKAALEAAKASLSEIEDEIALREDLDRIREERREIEAKQRDNVVARAVDVVQERLGEAHVGSVAIDGRPDWYVIVHNERAFQAYQRAINGTKKIDRLDNARTLAMAVIEVWNGIAVRDPAAPLIDYGGAKTTPGDALRRHLQANSAQVTPIVNETGRLAGLYASERKSGG